MIVLWQEMTCNVEHGRFQRRRCPIKSAGSSVMRSRRWHLRATWLKALTPSSRHVLMKQGQAYPR